MLDRQRYYVIYRIVTMFIVRNKKKVTTRSGERVYKSVLLVKSVWRKRKGPRHDVISNLSRWPKKLVDEFELLLRGGKVTRIEDLAHKQGKSCGGLIVVREVCKRLGITKALGNTRKGLLSMVMIMNRVISPGSRLYIAKVWAKDQAIEEVLKIEKFDEDNLYETMRWLDERQEEIENKLFRYREESKKSEDIFLYDVTSVYFEGEENEFAEFGHNRDKKGGKKQMVVGFMTDVSGYPVSIEVFKGNTQDCKTVLSQLRKLRERFGVKRVIFVGDRGMLKRAQIEDINEFKWKFITAITKAQIGKMIREGVFQLELFEEKLGEIEHEGIRYIVRRNPVRAQQIRKDRESKIDYIIKYIRDKNVYLYGHKRAEVKIALRNTMEEIGKRKLIKIIKVTAKGRELLCSIDEEAKSGIEVLDGCYAIKTDVLDLDKEILHDRYKDLTLVEKAFRTMKTAFEEIRPVYVRKKETTRAHAFICMLGYMVIKYVWDKVKDLGFEQDLIFETLDKIQYISYMFERGEMKVLPKELLEHQDLILNKLDIKLPREL